MLTDKEFKRLSRAELIEVIYQMQRDEEALRAENDRLKAELADRRSHLEKSGSIAEAALALNGVFEAAQAAADAYLAEIRSLRDELVSPAPADEDSPAEEPVVQAKHAAWAQAAQAVPSDELAPSAAGGGFAGAHMAQHAVMSAPASDARGKHAAPVPAAQPAPADEPPSAGRGDL